MNRRPIHTGVACAMIHAGIEALRPDRRRLRWRMELLRMRTTYTFTIRAVFLALCLALCAGSLPARAAGATYVFYEKFPSSNPNHWSLNPLKDGSRTYLSGGVYHVFRSRPGTMRGWPLGVKVPNGFKFNVQLKIVSGADPYAGVAFWDDLKTNFVFFALAKDGTVGLFRHTAKGYKILVDWRAVGTVHKGLGAVNSLSINLDPASATSGQTFLINGKPLGKPCKDIWRPALGKMPTPPASGFFVGVVAGAFKGATRVDVLKASMYDGTHLKAGAVCPKGR